MAFTGNMFALLNEGEEEHDVAAVAPKAKAAAAPVVAKKEHKKKEVAADPHLNAPREGGRGRGGKGGRGGRGEGGRPPKREFDRHVSGTGRGRGNPRDGQGRFNWGGAKDESQNPEQYSKEPVEVDPAVAAAEEEARAERERERLEEEKQMTLDEYRKQQAEAKKALEAEKAAVRQAGEGVDDKAWAGFELVSKAEVADLETQLGGKKKEVKTETAVKKAEPKKASAAASILNFTAPPIDRESSGGKGGKGKGRGGRGGRGEGRGRGGRGDRSQRGDAAAPNFADASSFPSLG